MIDAYDIKALNMVNENTAHHPLIISIADEKGMRVILEIDRECNISIRGTAEELKSVLDDPKNVHQLWVLKPIIILALEVLRLRHIESNLFTGEGF